MAWWKTAHVGQRVTPINENVREWTNPLGDKCSPGPQFGEVYTVHKIMPDGPIKEHAE